MKNLIILILSLSISTFSFGINHQTFHSIPAIYRIDDAEKDLMESYGTEWNSRFGTSWLQDFYKALESGSNTNGIMYDYPKEKCSGLGLKRILDEENLTFIIDGWLYVISYEPVNGSHDKMDYEKLETRIAWIYKKNVRTGGQWMKASTDWIRKDGVPYCGGATPDAFSLAPHHIKIGGTSAVRKILTFKGAVLILCGNEMTFSGSTKYFNTLLILCPVPRMDGSMDYFMHPYFGKYFDMFSYPKGIQEMLNGGETYKFTDNTGNIKTLNINFNNINGKTSISLKGYVNDTVTY